MNPSRPVAPALVCLLVLSPAAQAQEGDAEPLQEPIVVTATRTAQTADAALAPVVIITREEIESNPGADLTELLRLHPGVEISRNGPPGQQTSIFIRGADSNHTLVMVDGVKINPGTIGVASVQNIDPAMIERIEVVKGPRSTLYGSDAIGGVINIITRGAGAEPGTRYEARLNGGSHGTRGANLAAHNRLDEDKAAGISLGYEEADGIPTHIGTTQDRGYDLANLHAYGSQRIGNTEVRLSHWQAEGTAEYLDERFDPATFAFLGYDPVDQDFTNRVTRIGVETPVLDTWLSRLQLSRTVDEIDQNQSDDFTHTTRDALDWQNDVQVGERQLLTLGAYLAREDTRASVYGTGFDEDTDIRAAYVQDDVQWDRHRLLAGARLTDHEGFGSHTAWDLEYGFHATRTLQLIAAAATGFRAPDATDRFGFGGNPDLAPETSRNLELGLRYRPQPRQTLQVNAYENEIEDLIEYDLLAQQMQNIARARIRGIEANWVYAGESLRIEAGATRQDTEDRETGEELLRRAQDNARLSMDLSLGGYRFGADVLYTGERPDIDPQTYARITADAYTLLNLRVTTELAPGLRLAARVENATDEDYQLAAGFNTLGRSYYAELSYAFGAETP